MLRTALWPILTRTIPRWLFFAFGVVFLWESFACGYSYYLYGELKLLYPLLLSSNPPNDSSFFFFLLPVRTLPWWVFWLLRLQCVKSIFKWPRVIRSVQQCDSGDPLGALGALQAVKSFFLFSSVSIILTVIIYRCCKIIIRAYLNVTNSQASVSHIFMQFIHHRSSVYRPNFLSSLH